MLSSRRFYVELNNDRIRWRNQKNGLRQGSVLSPILFNIYTNDQPLHDGTRNFVYADDLYVTAQYPTFTEVEHTIEEALDSELNDACRSVTGCLRPTNVEERYLLAGIAPPDIRRDVSARVEKKKQETNAAHALHGQIPTERRLKRECLHSSV